MTEAQYAYELMRLVNAFQIFQAIHVAATVGIADHMAEEARTSEEIATKTGTNADALYRLLRILAAAGLFHEDNQKRFALTPLSRSAGIRPESLRQVCWNRLSGPLSR